MQEFQVRTPQRETFQDITDQVRRAVQALGVTEGVVTVFSPHTTAGVTINEGADPDVVRDMTAHFRRMVPEHCDFRHLEGNSDAHIKTTMTGTSVQVIVSDGRLMLGTWQKIYLAEFDRPRTRTVWVQG